MGKLLFMVCLVLSQSAANNSPDKNVWQCTLLDQEMELMKARSELINLLRSKPEPELHLQVAMLDYKLGHRLIGKDPDKALHFLIEGLEHLDQKFSTKQKSLELRRLALLYGITASMIPVDKDNFANLISSCTTLFYESEQLESDSPFLLLEDGKSKYYWQPQRGLEKLQNALANINKLNDEPAVKDYVNQETRYWLVLTYKKMGRDKAALKTFAELVSLNPEYENYKNLIFAEEKS